MDSTSCSAEGTIVQIDSGDEPDDFLMNLPHSSMNDKITPLRCCQRIYDSTFSLLDIWIPENILSRKTNTTLNKDKAHIYHTLQKPSDASFSTYMEGETEEYDFNSYAELSSNEIYQSDSEDVLDESESDDTDYDTINKFIALSAVDNRNECKVSTLIKSNLANESESLSSLNLADDNCSNISRDQCELITDAKNKTPVVALQNNLSLFEERKLSPAIDAQLYNNFSDDVCALESNSNLSTNDLNSDIDSALNVYLNKDVAVQETVAYSASSNENVITSSNNMPIHCGLDTSHNSDVYENIPEDEFQSCDQQMQGEETEIFNALQDRSYHIYTKPRNDTEKVVKNRKKNTRKAKKTMSIGLIDCDDEDYLTQRKNDAIEEFCRQTQDMHHTRDLQHRNPCEFPDLTPAAPLFNHPGNATLIDKHTQKTELNMKKIANLFAGKKDEIPYKDHELQNCSVVQTPIKNKIEYLLIIENIPSYVDQELLENWLTGYGEIHRFNLVPDKKHLKAELEIDGDLEWMVDTINGQVPFGAHSDPLKCHIEKRNW